MSFATLREPFQPDDIEWRIAQAGQKGEKIWAKCLAYITSRAIMDRLDEVVGPENWATDFRMGSHMMAGLGLRVGSGWVWKWDGTGMLATNDGLSGADAGKGDFSNGLKRVAVQWGMGRYLYDLPETWATVTDQGRFYQPASKKKGTPAFRWDPPRLPDWAVPGEVDPIIKDMERLWLDAQHVGVGANDEKDAAGMAAIETAITTGNVTALQKAKPWITGAIAAAKEKAA